MCTTASKPSRSPARRAGGCPCVSVSTVDRRRVVEPARRGRSRCRRRRTSWPRSSEVRAEQRADVALAAGDEDPHAASRRRSCSTSASAAALIVAELEPGALGDVEQRVPAVGEVQHPEQRELAQRSRPCGRRSRGTGPRRPSCGSHVGVEVDVASRRRSTHRERGKHLVEASRRGSRVGRGRGRRPTCGTRGSGPAACA